jgi:hypothetical protein
VFSKSLWVADGVHIAICLICRHVSSLHIVLLAVCFFVFKLGSLGPASALACRDLLTSINHPSILTSFHTCILTAYLHMLLRNVSRMLRTLSRTDAAAPVELCQREQEDRRNTSRDYQMCILKSGQKHQHAAAAGKPACLSYAQHCLIIDTGNPQVSRII